MTAINANNGNRGLNFNDRENSTFPENINATANYSNYPAGTAPSLTSLHSAAISGNAEIMQALLNEGAEVNAKDKTGNMPIHLAASSGKTEVVKILIEHDPSLINAKGRYNYTPLHWAVNKGHTETVLALLNNVPRGWLIFPRANINAKANYSDDSAGTAPSVTPLHLAARSGNAEIVQALLNERAEVNAKDKTGNMPIHLAASSGKTQIINLLLEYNSSLINAKGWNDYTPLHWAASKGHKEAVLALLNKGADVTAKDRTGDIPIHLAALNGKTDIVNLLIEYNSSLINAKGRYNYTPLHWAANKRHTETVLALLNKGADVSLTSSTGQTPLSVADNEAVASLLRSYGGATRKKRAIEENLPFSIVSASRNAINAMNAIGTLPSVTTLRSAVVNGNAETVQALIDAGANVTTKDKDGNMPIHTAALLGKTQVVNALIEHNSSLINAKGWNDCAPLHGAASRGHTETVLALLNKGANVTAKDKDGNMPIHVAALLGQIQVVNALIEHNSSLINAKGWNECAPLHWAARHGYAETLQVLINSGADVTAKDKAGNMPIHLAALKGKTEIVNALIEHDSSLINVKGWHNYTPLHWAAMGGNAETVRALLNKGADVTAKNIHGDMPIHLAAYHGKTEVVNVLIEHNSSLLNAKDQENWTPLHWAAMGGNAETVQALLNKGADVNAKDKDGNMSIHLAAVNGETDIVNLLIEHDSILINAKGRYNYTPLHWAAREGHTETVRALLNKGADVSLTSSAGQTPLSVARSVTSNGAAASLLRSHSVPFRNKRAIAENLSLSVAPLPHSIRRDITAIAPTRVTQANVATVGIAYNQSQELPHNNSSSAVGFGSFLSNQNVGLLHCIANAAYNSAMSSKINSRQSLINQEVPLVSTEIAVECALRDFASFVEKEMKNLNSEEQTYARSKLEKAYSRIIVRLEKAHQTNGEPGLDKALKLSKERFCDMLLTHAHIGSCLASVNVETRRQEVTRN